MTVKGGFTYYIVSLPLPPSQKASAFFQSSNESHEADLEDLPVRTSQLISKLTQSMTMGYKVAEIVPLQFPEFKIGTLDSLIGISDDLLTLDVSFESIATRLANHLKNLLEHPPSPVTPNLNPSAEKKSLLEASLLVGDRLPSDFVRTFAWNTKKYRIDKSLPEILAILSSEMNQLDTNVKNKLSQYAQSKANLSAIGRKNAGNLMVKSLAEVVQASDVLSDSEYMDTLFVAFSPAREKEFLNVYETLAPMVVPRSAKLVAKDDESVLYSILVFRKTMDEFKAKAKESDFTVREFTFNEEEANSDRQSSTLLGAQIKDQWSHLVRLVRTNFGDVFSGWVHLKAIRTFVESVLRYGLPPAYCTFLTVPLQSKMEKKKITNALYQTVRNQSLPLLEFGENSKANLFLADDEGLVAEGIAPELTCKEYLPFVQTEISWSGLSGNGGGGNLVVD